jgi:hypothetical protein
MGEFYPPHRRKNMTPTTRVVAARRPAEFWPKRLKLPVPMPSIWQEATSSSRCNRTVWKHEMLLATSFSLLALLAVLAAFPTLYYLKKEKNGNDPE